MTKHLPKTQHAILTFSILFFSFLFSANSQEFKFYGTGELLGNISDPFLGPGIGFESRISDHFTVNTDLNVGFNDRGTAYQFRPAVHYYFNKELKGVFIGPSLKYIRFQEKNNLDLFHDNVYTVGFTLGLRSNIKNNFFYLVSVAPHYALGASTSPGRQALGSIGGIGFNFGVGYRL